MQVNDVAEILEHWHAGRRMGELCSSLAVDPKTVRKYIAPALAAGLSPGGPTLSRDQWSALGDLTGFRIWPMPVDARRRGPRSRRTGTRSPSGWSAG